MFSVTDLVMFESGICKPLIFQFCCYGTWVSSLSYPMVGAFQYLSLIGIVAIWIRGPFALLLSYGGVVDFGS